MTTTNSLLNKGKVGDDSSPPASSQPSPANATPDSAETTRISSSEAIITKSVLLSGNTAAHILSAGFMSGMVVTAVLNPYDRALFLSVRAKRPFLSAANWKHPWHGVGQTLLARSLSTGLYFPLEEVGRTAAHSAGLEDGSVACSLVAGNFAGAVNALLLSPLAAVKYRSWGEQQLPENGQPSVVKAAIATYRRGGVAAFFTGFQATVCRDMTFGAVFALLRREVRKALFDNPNCETPTGCFIADAIAAGSAAVVSGPFNYARNRQFSHHSTDNLTVPSISDSLRWFLTHLRERRTLYLKIRYAQTRLMIGWGTLRVGLGMGLGALIYNALC